jgi:hypothetical protein
VKSKKIVCVIGCSSVLFQLLVMFGARTLLLRWESMFRVCYDLRVNCLGFIMT